MKWILSLRARCFVARETGKKEIYVVIVGKHLKNNDLIKER